MVELRDGALLHVSEVETVTALDGVTVEARSGEVLVLFGPSGSGKSTLLGVMGGLQRLDAGTVIVDGLHRIGRASAKIRRCAGLLSLCYCPS